MAKLLAWHSSLLLVFLFFATVCFVPRSWGAEDTADVAKLKSFLGQIEEQASSVDAFSCRFEQIKYLAIFSKPIFFYGNLSIDRPDKMRWEITKPLPSVLLLDGENGLQCSAGRPARKFNTVSDPVMKIVAKQIWSWMSGDYMALRESYTISQKGDFGILLEPFDSAVAKVISSVLVQFNPVTLQPTSVTISEAGKDRTELLFTDYVLNNSFADDYFSKCFLK